MGNPGLKQIHRVQLVVIILFLKQFSMRAVFDDAAVMHNIQIIGIFDRTQTVGDDNRRAVLAQQLVVFTKQSTMMIEDWEVGALYRSCLRVAGSEKEALEKVKDKYFEYFPSKTDLYFYLGTTKQWHLVAPNPFVIVGLFTPPKDNQMYLGF